MWHSSVIGKYRQSLFKYDSAVKFYESLCWRCMHFIECKHLVLIHIAQVSVHTKLFKMCNYLVWWGMQQTTICIRQLKQTTIYMNSGRWQFACGIIVEGVSHEVICVYRWCHMEWCPTCSQPNPSLDLTYLTQMVPKEQQHTMGGHLMDAERCVLWEKEMDPKISNWVI